MVKMFEIPCAGYSVMADWYDGEHTDEILLVLIGWTSNRKKYNDMLSAIVGQTGMSALVFDYSGHGDSPFDIDETRPAQHFLEVIYVFDQLKEKHPNAKITVMGTSYGGFMATQLTKYREFDRLVLRVPAIYPPNEFYTPWSQRSADVEAYTQRVGNIYRRDVEALVAHPLLARASNFKGKTLVVVHEEDEQVPKETTDAYIKAFNADTYIAKGFPHGIGEVPRDQLKVYQTAITTWLNQ